MKKKFLLILLVVLALSLTLAACEEIEQPNPHEHAFSEIWTYDEDYHWHKATCEHTDEIDGKAAHSLVPVPGDTRLECDVCGYSENVRPKPHQHTYAEQWSADESGHWYAVTCEHADAITVVPHKYVDGICDACGWWSSATDVLFANLAKSDVWNYVLSFDNVKVNDVNLLSEGQEQAAMTVSGELKLSLSADGQMEGCGCIEADGQTYKAVLSEGVVYACGTDVFFRCELDALLKQNGIDVQTYLDELNANTQQIREYAEELKQVVSNLPADGGALGELFSALVKLDETKSNQELSVFYVDTELMRGLNKVLSSTAVSDYVNGLLKGLQGTPLGVLLGDDFYGLPDKVYSLLKKTIIQTKSDLGAEDFTTDDLIDQINGIISNYYPDNDVNTIDELLVALGIDIAEIAKPLGVNLKGVTVKQLIDVCGLMSPESLWNLFQQDESAKISADEIKTQLQGLCEAYGDKTVYEIIAENVEYTAEQIKALVDTAADWLDENVKLEFYVDAQGTLRQISFTEEEQTFVLKRGSLEEDYSQVIKNVNAYYESLESAYGE